MRGVHVHRRLTHNMTNLLSRFPDKPLNITSLYKLFLIDEFLSAHNNNVLTFVTNAFPVPHKSTLSTKVACQNSKQYSYHFFLCFISMNRGYIL